MKQADLGDMFKKAPRNVCASTHAVSADPMSCTPTSSAMKTPENTNEDTDDPESADGHIQIE
jgi:hypothetical protein